eukprot:CAMPEP_0176428744 /NCGR_PEP_ID=MMETSP0127-20121128/13324_1 /TAXON_ID=938130 /ORGANISM="Platyophrya macrostoma, Strain WH" /LENGTH=104 /DNA_ID=CAMNT_0017810469 /DNA_START=121 /DNA_END=435 /DNA_ORIENTATION=+
MDDVTPPARHSSVVTGQRVTWNAAQYRQHMQEGAGIHHRELIRGLVHNPDALGVEVVQCGRQETLTTEFTRCTKKMAELTDDSEDRPSMSHAEIERLMAFLKQA